MNIKTFIVEKLLKSDTISDIINDINEYGTKGISFEGIANILIKFNFLTDFFDENYSFDAVANKINQLL